MPKFNKPPTVASRIGRHPDLTRNYEGGVAFKTDPKTELTLRMLTYLVNEPKFYGDKAAEMSDIQNLIQIVAEEDPLYLMQLAAYARNEMYLRSAPIFMLVEAAQYDQTKALIKDFTPAIIKRADELTEVIACFISKHGEIGARGKASIPNCLKEGIAEAFHNFDEYQYAKYDRDGDVKLKDVLRLVHPKPRNEEESALFKRIRDRTLKMPETWETAISGKGSTKEAWEAIIPKMGYMAKLRNLRNFLKTDADITKVVEHLTNPKAVQNSKQFPFRFLSAYKALREATEGDRFTQQALTKAVATALELSVANIPEYKGRTAVFTDNSGSMCSPISSKSNIQRIEVGNVMGALAYKKSANAIAGVFGEEFDIPQINPNDSVMSIAQTLINTDVGHSTNAWLALQYLTNHNLKVDRILIFSDEQCYTTRSSWWTRYDETQNLAAQLKLYKRTVNPNIITYSFDIAGYGTVQFPQDEPNVVLLAGWSEKVFTFIKMYEEFGKDMLHDIENYMPNPE